MVYHWMLYFSSEPIQIYMVYTECCIFHQNQYRYTFYTLHKSLAWNPPWNPLNFVKSAGFHDEIQWISWPGNSADFMKFGGFHGQMSQGPMVLFLIILIEQVRLFMSPTYGEPIRYAWFGSPVYCWTKITSFRHGLLIPMDKEVSFYNLSFPKLFFVGLANLPKYR